MPLKIKSCDTALVSIVSLTVFICPNGHETCSINSSGYQWFDLSKDNPDYILNETKKAEKKSINANFEKIQSTVS